MSYGLMNFYKRFTVFTPVALQAVGSVLVVGVNSLWASSTALNGLSYIALFGTAGWVIQQKSQQSEDFPQKNSLVHQSQKPVILYYGLLTSLSLMIDHPLIPIAGNIFSCGYVLYLDLIINAKLVADARGEISDENKQKLIISITSQFLLFFSLMCLFLISINRRMAKDKLSFRLLDPSNQ